MGYFSNTTLPTPPMWMRHILPWSLLHWLSNHFRVCWAHMVFWKTGLNRSGHKWSDLSDCKPDCYCGKYMTEETRAAIAVVEDREVPF